MENVIASIDNNNIQICSCNNSKKQRDTVSNSNSFDTVLSSTMEINTYNHNVKSNVPNVIKGRTTNYNNRGNTSSDLLGYINNNVVENSNITGNINTSNIDKSTTTSSVSSNNIEVNVSNKDTKTRIENAVKKASIKYGVDENLIKAIIKTESNFKVNATSHVGAKGLMQIMPINYKKLGITDPYNIEQNINGGTKLIKEFIDKYNGNVEMALMAYNGGPTRMANRGVKSVSDIYKMPKETQNYVKKVMGYYRGN